MYEGWIVRFGVPETVVTTDCETNFESDLFHSLTKYLYVHKTRTTVYNLKANGMVERFHRKVKKRHCDVTVHLRLVPAISHSVHKPN
ncbi:hypothetical protein TNIN_75391 [Trichonephila inaurata madagascariensis]|uniref:Integrase catalytic domain-containing protein n=1 Tax=Trichonephila inaurata madagascariensis TaxID=2747483 RepID=A0A8X6WWY5_9ARAC|nr:hypothetical protein TNIN_75391 [Trichonephila inaurata madagascariensis]